MISEVQRDENVHKPDDAYKAKVKPRFVRWVIDLCERPFDQDWLDYQTKSGFDTRPHGRTLPTMRPRRQSYRFDI